MPEEKLERIANLACHMAGMQSRPFPLLIKNAEKVYGRARENGMEPSEKEVAASVAAYELLDHSRFRTEQRQVIDETGQRIVQSIGPEAFLDYIRDVSNGFVDNTKTLRFMGEYAQKAKAEGREVSAEELIEYGEGQQEKANTIIIPEGTGYMKRKRERDFRREMGLQNWRN